MTRNFVATLMKVGRRGDTIYMTILQTSPDGGEFSFKQMYERYGDFALIHFMEVSETQAEEVREYLNTSKPVPE